MARTLAEGTDITPQYAPAGVRDTAFAALVVNSAGDGGPTCGPIVARFLNGL